MDRDEEQQYSRLDQEPSCICSYTQWCGGRAFACEKRACGLPLARCATSVFSVAVAAASAHSVAGFCTSGMRGVCGAALALAFVYNVWATWTPAPAPFPPSWTWLRAAARAAGAPVTGASAFAMVIFYTVAIAWCSWLCAASFAYCFIEWDDLIQWNCASGKELLWGWLKG